MSIDAQSEAETHTFPEIEQRDTASVDKLTMDDLLGIKLDVTAELGNATMFVKDIIALQVGSIVPLDKLAGEMTDINANGLPLARGEVVVIGDSLNVRLAEIRGRFGSVDVQEGDA